MCMSRRSAGPAVNNGRVRDFSPPGYRGNIGKGISWRVPLGRVLKEEKVCGRDICISPGQERTILLVDDSREYLETTGKLLEREGHTVLTAASGAEALAIAKGERVDLMLVDYFMPGMTGEDLVRQVRKFRPYLQIIIQTGYAGSSPPGNC